MSVQTLKIFVHLRKTNLNIFDEIGELSDPPIDSNATEMFSGPMWHQWLNFSFATLREYVFAQRKQK